MTDIITALDDPARLDPARLDPARLEPSGDEAGDLRTPLATRLAKRAQSLRAVPHIATYLGVMVIALGAVLLTVAWGRTAGLTNVALQIPYVVSAGCTGLALIVVGLTIINISAKQADASERARQTAELCSVLSELRRVIEGER